MAAHPAVRLLPLVAALVGAAAVFIGAAAREAPLPLDVAGVLLVVGAAAAWFSRRRPLRGGLFVACLAAVVVTVLYVLP